MLTRRSVLQLLPATSFGTSFRPTLAADNEILLGNFQLYTKGAYSAWPGMWSINFDPKLGLPHTAIEGVDFVSNILVRPDNFPDQSIVTWRVPNKPPNKFGVYGYLHIAYGNYDHTPSETPVVPTQVSDIDRFTVSLGFSYTSGATSASVLNEFWLTSVLGDLKKKIFEIGLYAHTTKNTANYVYESKLVGSYTDVEGRPWTVRINDKLPIPFIMFMPIDQRDVSGVIHWKEMLRYLVDKKILIGSEWINGVAVGPEPFAGSGGILFNSFSVSLTGLSTPKMLLE